MCYHLLKITKSQCGVEAVKEAQAIYDSSPNQRDPQVFLEDEFEQLDGIAVSKVVTAPFIIYRRDPSSA